MKSVASSELRDLLDRADAVLGELVEADLVPAGRHDASEITSRIERCGRQVDAARVRALRELDDSGLWAVDGHMSAKVMVRHVAKVSSVEAFRRHRASTALRHMGLLDEAYRNGEVGTDQVQRLARLYANRRVRDQLLANEAEFVCLAKGHSYKEFEALVADWERLADEDGTADCGEANHSRRDFTIGQEYNGGFAMSGRTGSIQGSQIEEILAHFEHSEFVADWERAVEVHGEGNVTKDMLERSDAQRRSDAHLKALQAGACNPAGGGKTSFITNIVLDLATFEAEVAKAAGTTPAQRDPWDPKFESRTLNGRLINTAEAAAAAIVHGFRRVVTDAKGVTIDLSRHSRLFVGSSRLAVQLMDCDCTYVGCEIDMTDCQIDHLDPWAEQSDGTGGGRTNPGNGAGACARHNRFKHNNGYRTIREGRHQSRIETKWPTYRIGRAPKDGAWPQMFDAPTVSQKSSSSTPNPSTIRLHQAKKPVI